MFGIWVGYVGCLLFMIYCVLVVMRAVGLGVISGDLVVGWSYGIWLVVWFWLRC